MISVPVSTTSSWAPGYAMKSGGNSPPISGYPGTGKSGRRPTLSAQTVGILACFPYNFYLSAEFSLLKLKILIISLCCNECSVMSFFGIPVALPF